MAEIYLPYRFEPRRYQWPLWRAVVDQGVKRAVCVWHRRAGKDKTFLNILVAKAMQQMGNYAYYFPTATLGRKALWDNIDAKSGMRVIDHLPPQLVRKSNEQQMKLTLVNGSTIQVLGTENLDVVGGNHFGVIFSESAQQNPLAWDYIRPILAENGGWALFNGTPRGKNWFYRLMLQAQENPDWYCSVLTVEDTGAITPEQIEAERRAGMREEMIRQEFYCDFTIGMPGAIYARFIEEARRQGRITRLPVDGNSLVHTAWDLGSPRNTVVWYFQTVGKWLRLIRCDREYDETLVARLARMKSLGFHYGSHFLPHDGVKTEYSGTTAAQLLREAEMGTVRLVSRRGHDDWSGINHAQQMFPTFEFDSENCRSGLEALEAYHTKEVAELGYTTNVPVHDWSSHAADAFRTMAEAHASGMFKFSHVDCLPEVDPWGEPIRKRRGIKPISVGG